MVPSNYNNHMNKHKGHRSDNVYIYDGYIHTMVPSNYNNHMNNHKGHR